jgi:hypothetical protein
MEACLQKQENDLWEMWALQYPQMSKESYISFEDYKDKQIIKTYTENHTQISYEEIEKEMGEVVKAYERR